MDTGSGAGWERLAQKVAESVPVALIDGLWTFPVMRQGQREWGTAVFTCLEDESGSRKRIHTARYMLQIKGKERGKFEASVEEVGSGPLEQIPVLLEEVHKRTDDEVPPQEVPVESWFPAVADAPAQ
ncbi:MAG TPA: hypothetical protein VK012_06540 [Gemmatimonadales bacterium]|nr:hypothetical protein [Gemmatimonadales bacterium]